MFRVGGAHTGVQCVGGARTWVKGGRGMQEGSGWGGHSRGFRVTGGGTLHPLLALPPPVTNEIRQ